MLQNSELLYALESFWRLYRC